MNNGVYETKEDDNDSVKNLVERYEDIENNFSDELNNVLPLFADWLKEKVFFVLEFLNNISYINSIDKIYVEDNLSGFAGGFTSQQTIVKLAKFNAILCFVFEDEFNMEVHNINPMTARKSVFGKARVKGIKAKDYVKMKVEQMYDTSEWCKTTSRGNWDKRNIDMYDGLVMSLYEGK